MNFIIYFLLMIVAFLVVIYLVYLFVKYKINHVIGKGNMNELINTLKYSKDLQLEEYTRPKSISGMTKLLEPAIIRDFPNFNREILYNNIEKNLNSIFRAIEKKNIGDIYKDNDLILLKESLKDYITDIKSRNVDITYSGVYFHGHAIKNYEKKDGFAMITTSSALEYFYTNSESRNEFENVKKQTRYICKFVYVFDESKIKKDISVVTIHCPNCGAPLNGLGKVSCTYCGSDVEPVNLKAWKMSEYIEDCGH